MTRNYFSDSVIAVVLGTGVGMILSVIGQKMLNQYYKDTCHQRPGHNLILSRGFLGDTYYCIETKYIVNQ